MQNTLYYFTESIGIKAYEKKPKINTGMCSSEKLTFYCSNYDRDRVFKNKESLIRHLKYQCKLIKSFKCGYCDHWAYYAFHIAEHLRIKHSNLELRILLLKENQLVLYEYRPGMRGRKNKVKKL